MLADYHIHTKMCGHATGEMSEYVAVAKEKGLAEIGFSDHIPMYFLPVLERDPGIAMKEEELPDYVERVKKLQRASDINIKLGLEADYAPGQEDKLNQILKEYPFDYVLGSIHFIDQWGFDNAQYIETYQKWDINELYTYYFELLQKAASSGAFDILAHADLIKKFGFKATSSMIPSYTALAKAVKKADICLEINTAGLRVPAGEMYPTPQLLEICYQHKIPVTIGSDAHKPEQVGDHFRQAVELLKKIGYREIATFTGRKRKMVAL